MDREGDFVRGKMQKREDAKVEGVSMRRNAKYRSC